MFKHMVRIWRKRNILPFLVGLQTAMTTMEINMDVPQKFSDRSTWGPRINLTGAWPATSSFHLMAYYSDFLIYWAMTLLLVSIWSLILNQFSVLNTIFKVPLATGAYLYLQIPLNWGTFYTWGSWVTKAKYVEPFGVQCTRIYGSLGMIIL